jgi:MFS family permease
MVDCARVLSSLFRTQIFAPDMLKTEKRAALSLSLIYAFRMLGLFMILPVFTLYAGEFSGATPLLIGLAIGVYGLTQGLFQLPFGFLSDHVGRKRMIIIGLLLFAGGSVIAALADSIQQIIIGRGLQGMGAIAAVVMALAADLTREEVRIRIMATIGMSIGLAFMVSMVLGPVLAANVGLSGIFWLTAGLALASLLIVLFITPNPEQQGFHRDAQLSISEIGPVASNLELLRLDLGVFVLHMVLAATFVSFPLVLRDQLGVSVDQHWKTYLPVFALSIVLMVPMILVAEKKRKMKIMYLVGILVVAVAEVGLFLFQGYVPLFIMLVLFFAGFNFLEATMPSLVAKIAKADTKGTAMGLFSSSQFLGAFSGGVLGGWMLGFDDRSYAYLFLVAVLLFWFAVASSMKNPKAVSSRIVSLVGLDDSAVASFRKQAEQLPGVQEITVYIEDRIAYMKIDKKLFTEEALDSLMVKR